MIVASGDAGYWMSALGWFRRKGIDGENWTTKRIHRNPNDATLHLYTADYQPLPPVPSSA